jgi:hypothetical protein
LFGASALLPLRMLLADPADPMLMIDSVFVAA